MRKMGPACKIPFLQRALAKENTVSSSSLAAVALIHLDRLWLKTWWTRHPTAQTCDTCLDVTMLMKGEPLKYTLKSNRCEMKQKEETWRSISSFACFKLTPFSSRAASGLLMLLTNLLTCSKCLVISVASTISMIACRSVRYSFLGRSAERGTELNDEGREKYDMWWCAK